jgi:hypothetical protein
MWSLVLDLLASTVFEWRLWKWIHDPPLKGDRRRTEGTIAMRRFLIRLAGSFLTVVGTTLVVLFYDIYWTLFGTGLLVGGTGAYCLFRSSSMPAARGPVSN